MKKCFAVALFVCLLFGGFAMAQDMVIDQHNGSSTSAVNYEVQDNVGFTVTIPPSVNIDMNTNTGSMTVALDASAFNVSGKTIAVALTNSQNSFKLRNDTVSPVVEFPYTIMLNTSPVSVGTTFLTWSSGEAVKTASATLTLTASPPANLVAGSYTDNVTFTVTVS